VFTVKGNKGRCSAHLPSNHFPIWGLYSLACSVLTEVLLHKFMRPQHVIYPTSLRLQALGQWGKQVSNHVDRGI